LKIMGLDLSITRTGVGLPDRTTFAAPPPKQIPGNDRLEYFADHIGLAARTARVDLVVIEGLGGLYKGEAARTMPMMHGAVRLELKRHRVPYMLLSPSSLKKFATGNGSADKTAMALAALKRLGREYATNDECDADWLRIAGRFAYGMSEVTDRPGPSLAVDRLLQMPQENLEALRWAGTGRARHAIVWPEVGGHKPWPPVVLR
jgi:Holliday junction resolvasome RuvABC endonuclease subunit